MIAAPAAQSKQVLKNIIQFKSKNTMSDVGKRKFISFRLPFAREINETMPMEHVSVIANPVTVNAWPAVDPLVWLAAAWRFGTGAAGIG